MLQHIAWSQFSFLRKLTMYETISSKTHEMKWTKCGLYGKLYFVSNIFKTYNYVSKLHNKTKSKKRY